MSHLKRVVEKASRATNALKGLMPRTDGPTESKRRVLASVAQSIILYVAPV